MRGPHRARARWGRLSAAQFRERPPRITAFGAPSGLRLATRARRRYKPTRNHPTKTQGGGSMNRREILKNSAALAVAAAAGIRPGFAQSPIVIKFSHVVAVDAPKGKASEKFRELVERYTGGKVKVEVYPNSSLYKDKEELEALQLGAVQMLAPSTAKFGPLGAKEFEALDLPWLFKDDLAYANAMKGSVGQWLFTKLESKGISGLAYWDNGFHMVSANRPLLAPADFQGLKIRISGSKIADQYFRELGSIPQ